MPAGLQILNDGGTIQIDETYKNFVMVDKGTRYFPGGTNINRDSILVGGRRPFLALCGPQGVTFALESTYWSGGTKVFNIVMTSGGTLEWFAFDDTPNQPAQSGAGIEVRNAANEITFSTAFKQSRLNALIGPFLPRTHAYPGGKEAVAFLTPSIAQEGGYEYYTFYMWGASMQPWGEAVVQRLNLENTVNEGVSFPSFEYPSVMALLDVTNF